MNMTQEPNSHTDRGRENLLGKLKEAQQQYGYVSREIITETAQAFGLPISEVYGITTFYSFLSTRPLGKYVIRICRSIPCDMQNTQMIIDSIAAEIGIEPGQTTADGKFSFELTNCIGACDLAPAMLVNHELYGHLTPDKIKELLRVF
ncbi:MAG: NADH-quinone oxidoreductase subunit NuoE [bacterium]|nr:NADH-quinone oxidoreductase subunit NuoE [bacterium]